MKKSERAIRKNPEIQKFVFRNRSEILFACGQPVQSTMCLVRLASYEQARSVATGGRL